MIRPERWAVHSKRGNFSVLIEKIPSFAQQLAPSSHPNQLRSLQVWSAGTTVPQLVGRHNPTIAPLLQQAKKSCTMQGKGHAHLRLEVRMVRLLQTVDSTVQVPRPAWRRAKYLGGGLGCSFSSTLALSSLQMTAVERRPRTSVTSSSGSSALHTQRAQSDRRAAFQAKRC
ncbi:hypothetical protein MPTK1_7g07560 [Marchantia polymorpha subsp. ruderalis]